MVKSKRNLFSTMSSILKKSTVVTLCMILIGLFLSVGCKKEKNGEETNGEAFCSYVNAEDLDKTIPLINEFLKDLSNDLNDEQKLQALVTWLKSYSCIVDAEILCVSCIFTLPAQSEIFISFKEKNITRSFILDIVMDNPLTSVRYHEHEEPVYNKILMLIVDEQTNTFIGGKEMVFSQIEDSFTITYEYVSPGDFGYLKLFYKEIDELLFHGTIFWMGTGEIIFPSDLLPPDQFDRVTTDDYVSPNGFGNIFDPDQTYDYGTVWNAVQSLVKAREYLYSNPHQKVKICGYSPTSGMFPPVDRYWIVYLKQ